jgi:hypothetical protein
MTGTKDATNSTGANSNVSNNQGAAPSIKIVGNADGTQSEQKMTKKQLQQKKLEEASQSFNKVVEEFYSSYAKYNSDLVHLGINRIKESIKVINGLLDTKDSTKVMIPEVSKVMHKYVKSLDGDATEFFGMIANGVASALLYRDGIQQARSLEKSGLYSNINPVKVAVTVDTKRKHDVKKFAFRKQDMMMSINDSSVDNMLKSKTAEEKAKAAREKISARIGEEKKLVRASENARKELTASTESMVIRNARNFVLERTNRDSVAKEVVDRLYRSNRSFKSEVVNKSDISELIKKADEYSAAYKKSAEEHKFLTYDRRKMMRVSRDMERLSGFLRRMENVIG